MTRLTERDKKMLEMLCHMDTVIVADKLGIKVTTINSRFEWLRKKKEENQTFINQLLVFSGKCDSIKKRLISSKRKKPDKRKEATENE
jgi:hypothetical protein